MSKRFLLVGAAVLAAAPLAAAPLAAQRSCNTGGSSAATCEVRLTTEVTVPDLMRLDLSQANLDLGMPSVGDFEAGHRDMGTPLSVSVKANRPYKVTIEAAEPVFGYVAPAGTSFSVNKPATDLLWSRTSDGFEDGRNVGTPSDLGGDDSATEGRDADVFFRTKYSFANDKPGNYSLDVKFTIAAK